MSAKWVVTFLVGIVILASFLRFYRLTDTPPGLYMDEAMDGVNAQHVARNGQFQVFYPEDNGREGLYVNIIALLYDSGLCLTKLIRFHPELQAPPYLRFDKKYLR
jgi:hypothetical protein